MSESYPCGTCGRSLVHGVCQYCSTALPPDGWRPFMGSPGPPYAMPSITPPLAPPPLDERRASIRDVAVRLYGIPVDLNNDLYSPETAWARARALWDGKPSDC